MIMTNIKINKVRDNYFTVVANTERFGDNEIMFEGTTERECELFLNKEKTGYDNLRYLVRVNNCVRYTTVNTFYHLKDAEQLVSELKIKYKNVQKNLYGSIGKYIGVKLAIMDKNNHIIKQY